jgi:hypothetical protein
MELICINLENHLQLFRYGNKVNLTQIRPELQIQKGNVIHPTSHDPTLLDQRLLMHELVMNHLMKPVAHRQGLNPHAL